MCICIYTYIRVRTYEYIYIYIYTQSILSGKTLPDRAKTNLHNLCNNFARCIWQKSHLAKFCQMDLSGKILPDGPIWQKYTRWMYLAICFHMEWSVKLSKHELACVYIYESTLTLPYLSIINYCMINFILHDKLYDQNHVLNLRI